MSRQENSIDRLTAHHASEVSALAIRSKAVWDYPEEQMAVFREELTMTGAQLEERITFGWFDGDGELSGYYTIVDGSEGNAELEHLFVDPLQLRCGIGGELLSHAIAQCEQRGIRFLEVLSDPNAAGFYHAMKAEFVADIPSSIPGRTVPKFQFDVVHREFLASTDVIDWQHDSICELAEQLAHESWNEEGLIQNSFEWVRDNIQHCMDFDRDEITCVASDVLRVGTGFCYAKSHLLAALLRANGIPAGFCYQRLRTDDDTSPLCIHGLNAVFVRGVGWYRVDCRGNKPGVDAQFQPPREQLAFSTTLNGEEDYADVWAEPILPVVEALSAATSARAMACDVPDLSPNEYLKLKEPASVRPIPLQGTIT